MLLHRNVCTQTGFYTHTYFYTEMILHKGTLHTEAVSNKGALTKEGIYVHKELLHTDPFTQTYILMISDCGHTCPVKEFSKQMQRCNFIPVFND